MERVWFVGFVNTFFWIDFQEKVTIQPWSTTSSKEGRHLMWILRSLCGKKFQICLDLLLCKLQVPCNASSTFTSSTYQDLPDLQNICLVDTVFAMNFAKYQVSELESSVQQNWMSWNLPYLNNIQIYSYPRIILFFQAVKFSSQENSWKLVNSPT